MKHTQGQWKIDNTFARPRIYVDHQGGKKILFNASGDTDKKKRELMQKLALPLLQPFN